jgi:hypothetical protein
MFLHNFFACWLLFDVLQFILGGPLVLSLCMPPGIRREVATALE